MVRLAPGLGVLQRGIVQWVKYRVWAVRPMWPISWTG